MDRAAGPPVVSSGGDTPIPRLVAERVTLPIRLRRHLPRLTEVLCVFIFLTLNDVIVCSTRSDDASSNLLTNMPLSVRFVTLHIIFTLPRTMPAKRFETAELHFLCSQLSDIVAHSCRESS